MTSPHHDDDRVAQYVAGTMSAGEVEEFEQHLLTCETCRSAVRLGATTRAALVTERQAATPQVPPFARSLRPRPAWLVAVAAAVVLMVVATRDGSRTDALGRIEPAPFTPGALRPSMDSVTALVDSGMASYRASDFGAAAERLERAASLDSSVAVRFFLGVSLLMRGDEDGALRVLQRVPGESPYGIEATYYQAKALVRMNRIDSAVVVLERGASAGPVPELLRAFADSLRRR